jgi:hypothetical protein
MSLRRYLVFFSVSLFLIWWFGNPLLENFKREDRVAILEAEVADLEVKRDELRNYMGYVSSDQFVEFEARERLHYLYPNERMLIIPAQIEATFSQLPGKPIQSSPEPNWEQWLELITNGYGHNK